MKNNENHPVNEWNHGALASDRQTGDYWNQAMYGSAAKPTAVQLAVASDNPVIEVSDARGEIVKHSQIS